MSKVFNMVGGGGGPAASIFVTGLSQTDTVTATNGSKTLNGKWTQKPNPEYIGLPDGYTQLEYIESTGTQYIDTGVKSVNQRLRTKVRFSDFTSTDYFFVGAFWQTGEERIYHPFVSNGQFGVSYAGNSKSLSIVPSANTVYDIDSTMYSGNQNVEINGTKYLTSNDTYSFTANYSLYLFASNDRGSAYKPGKMRMYYAEVYNNGAVVRNYIPAKRNSDSAIGLYDLVSDTFFGNAGTGTFIAGAEVPQNLDGFLIKPIRDFGNWTVTATNGTKTATQDVLVDVITEYEIEMHYNLYLYRDGDSCEDLTGGWSQKSVSGRTDATVAMNETNISWYQTPGQIFRLSTNNPVDFTGYSKLIFQRSQTVEKSSSYDAVIIEGACSNPSATPATMGNEGTVAYKDPQLNTSFSTTNVEIDVSGVTGSYYVYIRSDQSDYSGLTISGVINKVWLE